MVLEKKWPIIDDVGSFPLPDFAQKEMFYSLYWNAYDAMVKGIDVSKNRGVQTFVLRPIIETLKLKIQSGIEVVNYPQHMDMYTQFIKPINDYQIDPYLIDQKKAKIVELELLRDFAKDYYEENGESLKIKSCVTGPMELYAKMNGFSVYKDIALNLAKSVNHFLKNSIFKEKYVETQVVSIDEPSIGLVTFNQIKDEEITEILDKSSEGIDSDVQIHLHSLNSYELALKSKNINVLTCEYASNQKNVIPKKDLDDYDKYIRVGISRTAMGSIIAEEIDKGVNPRKFEGKTGLMNIVDSKERIKKRYLEAHKRYDDRLKYVGPDCGLKSWDYQNVAYQLILRTAEAAKEIRDGELIY